MYRLEPVSFVRRSEVLALFLILAFLIVVSYFNFQASFRRARDNERRSAITQIAQALEKFYQHYGFYPLSSPEGKMMACAGPTTLADKVKKIFQEPVACEWGKDNFGLIPTNPFEPSILSPLPTDPSSQSATPFFYLSNGRAFQIYAFFEGKNEKEYDEKIAKLGLKCGQRICNVGKSSEGASDLPLDKPLEKME